MIRTRERLLPTLGLLLLAGSAEAASTPPGWPSELQTAVVDIYRKGFKGEIHLYVKDLGSGRRFEHHAATPTYIASVVKVLFMVELFDQVARGELSLDEYMLYEEGDVRGGAPLFNYLPVGAKLPLRAIAEAMIHQSDNTASDMIARRVGMDRINAGLAARGYTGFGEITSLIDVRRRVYSLVSEGAQSLDAQAIRTLDFAKGNDARAARLAQLLGTPGAFGGGEVDDAFEAYYATGANSATMEAVGRLLEDLALGKVVSSTASKEMVELMLGTQTGANRMAAGLPAELKIAHKTGTQYRRTCDVGIMYVAEERPVVFAACVKGATTKQREAAIAQLAVTTYRLLAGGAPEPKKAGKKKKEKKTKKPRRKSVTDDE